MLHSFFDRTLYIHHVERFGLCKKKEKNISVCAPKSMRRKKKEERKMKDSSYLSKREKGEFCKRGM